MTKETFKKKWESNESGGGLTFDDIAQCAKEWGVCSTPRTQPMDSVRYKVLLAADCVDAEEFSPTQYEDY